MHGYLRECIGALTEFWQKDPRAVAFAMNGSGGRGNDDEWSDGDVSLVVADEAYLSVYNEMRGLMSRYCGEIRLWLPEGETERGVNFAFLFEKDGEQFLMDHALFCEGLIKETPHYDAGVIFFDRSGALTEAGRRFAEHRPEFDVSTLPVIIDTYMVYTYLNGKYYRRKDTAKMLYIQNTLQGLHFRLLQALYPDVRFLGWWCQDIYSLSEEHQQSILMYAAMPDYIAIGAKVIGELLRFGEDARRAAGLYGKPYPEDQEVFVLRQLKDAGMY